MMATSMRRGGDRRLPVARRAAFGGPLPWDRVSESVRPVTLRPRLSTGLPFVVHEHRALHGFMHCG